MSRVTQVGIEFQANLSAARKAYDEFLKDVESRRPNVNFGVGGVQVGPGATFGTPGGAPSGGGGAPGAGAAQSAAAQVTQNINNVNQQIQNIVNQLTQVSTNLNTVVNNLANTTNNVSNNLNNVSNIANTTNVVTNNITQRAAAAQRSGFGGLGRILGVGTVLRGLEHIYEAGVRYDRDTALAGGDQRAQVQAQLAYRDRLTGIPFAGPLGEFLTDPGGRQRTGIELTLRDADEQERRQAVIARGAAFRQNVSDQLYIAQGRGGFERQGRELEVRRDRQTREARDQYRVQVEEQAEQYQKQQDRINREEDQARQDRYSSGAPFFRQADYYYAAIETRRAQRLQGAAVDRQSQVSRLTRLFGVTQQQGTEVFLRQRRQDDLDRVEQLGRIGVEGETARRALTEGGDDARLFRLRETNRLAEERERERDPVLARRMAAANRQIEAAEAYDIARSQGARQAVLTGSTGAAQYRAQNKPFEAGLSELIGHANAAYLQADSPERQGVMLNNVAKIVEYGADFARKMRSINLENYGAADIGRMLLGGDERGAAIARVRQQRDEELANAPGGLAGYLIRGGIRARYAVAEQLTARDVDTSIFARQQGLRDTLKETTLDAQGKNLSSNAQAIYDAANRQAEIYRRQSLGTEADLTEQIGRQSLLAYRRQLVRGSGAAAAFEPGTLGQGYDLSKVASSSESPQSAIAFIDDLLKKGFGGGGVGGPGGAGPTITKEQGEDLKTLLQRLIDVFQ
jgi:hypothetical protein